jgi:hypothetical protein
MALALFDARALEEQFGMKPQRFPDRVSSFPEKTRTELTSIGSKGPHPLQAQGRGQPDSRNTSNVPRAMQNQHVNN